MELASISTIINIGTDVQYIIKENGRDSKTFKMDENNVNLVAAKELDREKQEIYKMSLEARVVKLRIPKNSDNLKFRQKKKNMEIWKISSKENKHGNLEKFFKISKFRFFVENRKNYR